MANDRDERELMTRREAILRVSALLGGVALVGQAAMLAGCERREPQGTGDAPAAAGAPKAGPLTFTKEDIALLDEVAETILPETDTPGAKAAGVGPFIAMMVTDCYEDREQRTFHEGFATLDDRCREMHGATFLAATPEQRLALVEALDAEQKRYMDEHRDAEPAHWFRMLKELTLLGYFTSEIGYTQAMRYVETPGRYDPCVPWKPGEKTWASHA
jgi:hypothetical protein